MTIFNINTETVQSEANWVFDTSEQTVEDEAKAKWFETVTDLQVEDALSTAISADDDYYYAAYDRAVDAVMRLLTDEYERQKGEVACDA